MFLNIFIYLHVNMKPLSIEVSVLSWMSIGYLLVEIELNFVI